MTQVVLHISHLETLPYHSQGTILPLRLICKFDKASDRLHVSCMEYVLSN